MEQAFKYMKNMYQPQTAKNNDDECSVFGVLIAKKLRKLSEERRDVMMVKINQLFIEERRKTRRRNSLSTMVSNSPSPSGYEAVNYNSKASINETNSSHEYILPSTKLKYETPFLDHDEKEFSPNTFNM